MEARERLANMHYRHEYDAWTAYAGYQWENVPDTYEGKEHAYKAADTLLRMEFGGIPLSRLIELQEQGKLVVLDDNQKLPEPVYLGREYLDPAWVEEAVKSDMLQAKYKRVNQLAST